jgi:hypothetical protein
MMFFLGTNMCACREGWQTIVALLAVDLLGSCRVEPFYVSMLRCKQLTTICLQQEHGGATPASPTIHMAEFFKHHIVNVKAVLP